MSLLPAMRTLLRNYLGLNHMTKRRVTSTNKPALLRTALKVQLELYTMNGVSSASIAPCHGLCNALESIGGYRQRIDFSYYMERWPQGTGRMAYPIKPPVDYHSDSADIYYDDCGVPYYAGYGLAQRKLMMQWIINTLMQEIASEVSYE